jgi:PAS domain S-box-containing protein
MCLLGPRQIALVALVLGLAAASFASAGASSRHRARPGPGRLVAAAPVAPGRDSRLGAHERRLHPAARSLRRSQAAVSQSSLDNGRALPWIILALAVTLGVLAAALRVNTRRRAQAQGELDQIFNLAADMIAVGDFDGRMTRINRAVRQVLGYTEEEFLAKPYLEFVHPDDRRSTAAEAAAIVRGKRTLSFENRFEHKDGSYRVLDWTATPVVEQQVIYGVARDVTERHKAEAERNRLADEQAALRRVATLVANEAPPPEVFAAVTEEAAQVLDTDAVAMLRLEPDGSATLIAQSPTPWEPPPLGTRLTLEGENVLARVFATEQTVRFDDWEGATGAVAAMAQRLGIRSSVGTPIVVNGRPWGAMIAASGRREPLATDAESRIGQFTALVATAIANAEARSSLSRLVDEQAALRRVAMLVAEDAPAAELLAKVTEEVGSLFGFPVASVILRYEPDHTATVAALWGGRPPGLVEMHDRLPIDDTYVTSRVFREQRPVRVDDYSISTGEIAHDAARHGIASAVGCPIVVPGRLWGAMVVARYASEPLPGDTERRVSQFTELISTAIANAEARAEVRELAEEQAALRRVATLVAEGAPATAVFEAVAGQMERVLGAHGVTLSRYEPHEEVTVLAHSGSDPRRVPTGTRISHRGNNVTSLVRASKRSARMEHREASRDEIAELTRGEAVRASVGAPIVVEGELWGVAVANWRGEKVPHPDTEERMARFAELLDTAVANADSRDQLAASRARLVTEADDARRRVVRDLHDGAQQRLVHTIVTLKLAQRAQQEDGASTDALIAEALEHAQQGNAALRELAHGILPAILIEGGLRAGIETVVSRLDLPVEVHVPDQRFSTEVEASAYFIVSEALTNVVKHSHASRAEVRSTVAGRLLRVEVRDDGIGGADPNGHGLVGLADRVSALGGRLHVESPTDGGTVVTATLPLSP